MSARTSAYNDFSAWRAPTERLITVGEDYVLLRQLNVDARRSYPNRNWQGLGLATRAPYGILRRSFRSLSARTSPYYGFSAWRAPTERPVTVDEDFVLLRVLCAGDSDGASPVETGEETVTQEVPYTEDPTEPYAARCYRATAP